MPRTIAAAKITKIDEKNLTKGQLRKLNALRKSLGTEIAERAFAEWLAQQTKERPAQEDKVAAAIAEAVENVLTGKNLRMPRGGYFLKRGRGRVLVTPTK